MRARILSVSLFLVCLASPSIAGPSLIQAQLHVIHRGTNISPRTASTPRYHALPIGQPCASAMYACSASFLEQGMPVTGSGTFSAMGTRISLPANLLQKIGAGSFPVSLPTLFNGTQANLANATGWFSAGYGPGSFFTSPGPAGNAVAQVVKGSQQFGGSMRILGSLIWDIRFTRLLPGTQTFVGPHGAFLAAGGTGTTTTIWRSGYRFAPSYSPTVISSYSVRNTGFRWTTGQARVSASSTVANGAYYYTRLVATGFNTTTAMGIKNIQLVTPVLTHYLGPNNLHTGAIAILNLQFAPEPSAWLSLGAGILCLFTLHRVGHR